MRMTDAIASSARTVSAKSPAISSRKVVCEPQSCSALVRRASSRNRPVPFGQKRRQGFVQRLVGRPHRPDPTPPPAPMSLRDVTHKSRDELIAELERAVEIAIDERDEARKEADFWREQATEDRREER